MNLIIFLCADVEKNPGPYNIAKIVQVSVSHGHEKFGVIQAIQCTCISLYSVCFSSFKTIFAWLSEDLEYAMAKWNQSHIDIIVIC